MQKTMLLLAAAACALSALACATLPEEPEPWRYRYNVGILTPNTPEGLACRRECLTSVGTCSYYRQGALQVTIEAGRYSRAYGCPGMVSDCLELCPGAIVDPDNPPEMIPVYPTVPAEEDGHEFAD